MGKKILFGLLLCKAIVLSGCYKNHLYVQQEWIDASFLASVRVGTPDPRKEHPPTGQRLLIAWDFPRSLFLSDLTLSAKVRFLDGTEEVHLIPLDRKRSSIAIPFPDAVGDMRILTYLVEVVDRDGHLVEEWRHHFWTNFISVDAS